MGKIYVSKVSDIYMLTLFKLKLAFIERFVRIFSVFSKKNQFMSSFTYLKQQKIAVIKQKLINMILGKGEKHRHHNLE